MKKPKILVGISGGVDSAVSAYLLQKQGYDVTGGFMINYFTEADNCTTKKDLEVAKEVAEYLGIELFTFDFIEEYEKRILNMIYEGYKKGLTPNPDVFCNSLVKFDLFQEEAISYGFDKIATGHYARVREDENGFHLLKGIDHTKDQSYFLSTLSNDQLSKALFPIGELEKTQVREIALEAGLPNATRKDSQGLCFVGKVNFWNFLKEKISPQKGDILDVDGNIIGEHDGAFQYTIGQRKGIGVGGGPARFVINKNTEDNTITVGTEKDYKLYTNICSLQNWHWINTSLSGISTLSGNAKIRYRQEDQEVEIIFWEDGIQAKFKKPQRAITPGQILALYIRDELVGSGVIK